MKAKEIQALLAISLMLTGFMETGPSFADGPGIEGPGPGVALRGLDFKMLSPIAFFPSCGCPDIAYTKTFQTEGLGYVSSPEFGEAVRAVANGFSEFSPDEIPPDWRASADSWKEYILLTTEYEGNLIPPVASFHIRGGDLLHFPKGKYACNPELLHLASQEFMKTQDREDLTPISPRAVNAATKELQSLVDAKRRMARTFAVRAAAIASRIAEAERTGGENCPHAGVARAKWELEQAFNEARTVRVTHVETVSSFDRAERYAENLLSERRFASSRGGSCE